MTPEPQREYIIENLYDNLKRCRDCSDWCREFNVVPFDDIEFLISETTEQLKKHDAALRAQWEQEQTTNEKLISTNLVVSKAKAEERERVLKHFEDVIHYHNAKELPYPDLYNEFLAIWKEESLRSTAPTTTSQPGGDQEPQP